AKFRRRVHGAPDHHPNTRRLRHPQGALQSVHQLLSIVSGRDRQQRYARRVHHHGLPASGCGALASLFWLGSVATKGCETASCPKITALTKASARLPPMRPVSWPSPIAHEISTPVVTANTDVAMAARPG